MTTKMTAAIAQQRLDAMRHREGHGDAFLLVRDARQLLEAFLALDKIHQAADPFFPRDIPK